MFRSYESDSHVKRTWKRLERRAMEGDRAAIAELVQFRRSAAKAIRRLMAPGTINGAVYVDLASLSYALAQFRRLLAKPAYRKVWRR